MSSLRNLSSMSRDHLFASRFLNLQDEFSPPRSRVGQATLSSTRIRSSCIDIRITLYQCAVLRGSAVSDSLRPRRL